MKPLQIADPELDRNTCGTCCICARRDEFDSRKIPLSELNVGIEIALNLQPFGSASGQPRGASPFPWSVGHDIVSSTEIAIQSEGVSEFVGSKRVVKIRAGSRDGSQTTPILDGSCDARRVANLLVTDIYYGEIDILCCIKLVVDFAPDFEKSFIVIVGIGKLSINPVHPCPSGVISFNIEGSSAEAVVFHLVRVKFADIFD